MDCLLKYAVCLGDDLEEGGWDHAGPMTASSLADLARRVFDLRTAGASIIEVQCYRMTPGQHSGLDVAYISTDPTADRRNSEWVPTGTGYSAIKAIMQGGAA